MLLVPPGVELLLDGFPLLPLKLGSLLPVAGPLATYSLLLLEKELPGLTLPLVFPGAELLEKFPEELPGVFVPAVVFEAGLFTFNAFPLLVVQAPLAAKV